VEFGQTDTIRTVVLSQSLLLRGARQLLTLRGEPSVRRGPLSGNLEVIEDGSVFIKGGKIVSVGTTRRLENLKEIRGAIQIPAHNCIVMPGFIDSSIELSLAAAAVSGKTALKRRKLSEFYSDSLTLMRACLQHGTLNAGIRARPGIAVQGAGLSVLRQLARIGNNPIGVTRIWCPDSENLSLELAWMQEWETVCKRRLAQSVALQPGDARMSTAVASQMPINLDWMSGSADELAESLARTSPTSVLCDHSLSVAERKLLANSKTTTVFKAGGVLLDSQPGDSVRELVDAGGAVALGSGYDAVYEPNFNMQLVLAVAVRRLKLTIEEAIVATTINAAHAMNCADQIGSLEPGKRADVLVLNLRDYREIPRRLGVNHVAMAIRQGELVINRTRWRVGAA
jgi:imidazolonepropionase